MRRLLIFLIGIRLLQFGCTIDSDLMLHHFSLDFLNRDSPTLILINLIEKEPYFFLSDLRRDIIEEFMELCEIQLTARIEPQ